ncbi:MAG: DUF6448 family protein [Ignavibacteria bacterium]|jgi:hypothetical protein|nr:DUF6448 family protein [Ignavibacteria bacterium]
MKSKSVTALIIVIQLFFISNFLSAHCDTMDGPVAKDARKALETNNVNLVLKWVMPAGEKEIIDAFALTIKVRSAGADAKLLADTYFIETLVRVHRSGEGVAYTGVKAAGTPIDKKILAADKSIETGSLQPLKGFVPESRMTELKEKFDKVMALKNFDTDDVKAGREYVEAYVKFFHYAEGEDVTDCQKNGNPEDSHKH